MEKSVATREHKEELLREGSAVVRHMCRALMELYEFWPKAVSHMGEGLLEYKLEQVDGLINELGDVLNGMDAVTEDDDFTAPVFEKFATYFGRDISDVMEGEGDEGEEEKT